MADYERFVAKWKRNWIKKEKKKTKKQQKHAPLDERIFNEAPHANAMWTRYELSASKHMQISSRGLHNFKESLIRIIQMNMTHSWSSLINTK